MDNIGILFLFFMLGFACGLGVKMDEQSDGGSDNNR